MGLNVCTPIDLSNSKHFDLRDIKLLDWIFQMLAEKRFKSVILEPPCTSFSPAQHPASRSYEVPLGFDRTDPKTHLGNLLAFRCMLICLFALIVGAIALLEQPRLSKMAWLKAWQYLIKRGFREAIIASCAFGSIHRKEFRFLGHGIDMKTLEVRCSGDHTHVRIQGKFTKASAVYTPKLAKFLAQKIAAGLRKNAQATAQHLKIEGHESVILNDLLFGRDWAVEHEWAWRRPGHINVLESNSFVSLLKKLCVEGGDLRFTTLLDSRVAKGAHAKGRSSSKALQLSLRKACAYTLAGKLHPSFGFAPTRLNVADAPTRLRPLPTAASVSVLDFLSDFQISHIHSLQFLEGCRWLDSVLHPCDLLSLPWGVFVCQTAG